MTSPQAVVSAENLDRVLVEIPVANIHPDPKQPRLHPDDELAASIKTQGILVPFTVERLQILDDVCPDCGLTFAELEAIGDQYMINDGERRWRGAKQAGLKNVDVFVVQPTSSGKRLLRQVTSNTGKPLTPIEEALAYKSIMEEEGWNQAELARNLGKPKSLVGDRIRLVELDQAWLDKIHSGELQVSHAPIISTFSKVPAAYQAKAVANLLEDYRANRFLVDGGAIPVDTFRHLIYVAFRDYIKPLADVRGYKGPVIEISGRYGEYSGGGEPKREKYAADIKLWRPIFNKHQNKRRKERQRDAGSGGSAPRERKDLTVQRLEESIVAKRQTSEYHPKANAGEYLVYVTDQGWDYHFDADPETFLAKVDPAKLTRVYAKYTSGITTTDAAAVAAAREGLNQKMKAHLDSKLAEIRGVMRAKGAQEYTIRGPGTIPLLLAIGKRRRDNPLPVLALALGIGGFGEKAKKISDLDENEATTLATAYVAVEAGAFKVPDAEETRHSVKQRLFRSTPFKLAARGADGQPVESKKARKRAARAAGEKVGDPSRAPKQELAAAGV